MNFGKIDGLILFGGGRLMVELIRRLDRQKCEVIVFSDPRHLEETPLESQATLLQLLEQLGVRYYCSPEINHEPALMNHVTDTTLGLGMGEVWSFSSEIIKRFAGRLVDLMTIPLPQYRGGAHYTWQILSGNRRGGCHIQMINEEMLPGRFDSGDIVESESYRFPASARIPQDYFNHSARKDLAFVLEFLRQVNRGKEFSLTRLREERSIFFPRLNTRLHGFIDWSWSAMELERFLAAFDRPYAGASSFLQDRRFFLRAARALRNEGDFHPYQAGLIYRMTKDAVFIATRGGAIRVTEVLDEEGVNALDRLETGLRFHTPQEQLEEARTIQAEYDLYERAKR